MPGSAATPAVLTYHRIGDSFLDDQLTFYSDNTLSRLRYNPS